MDPQERNAANLWDMREAARSIIDFLQIMTYGQFSENRMVQAAVERQLEIIGEAARRISSDFHADHPEIPWRSIIGLRNILIHEYGEVRSDRIWLITRTGIPQLIVMLDPLIPPIDDEGEAA